MGKSKIIALTSALMMLLSVTASADYSAQITEVGAVGKILTAAQVSLPDGESGTFYAAVYENGLLKAVDKAEVESNGDVKLTGGVEYDSGLQTLKCFVWDGMSPISEIYDGDVTEIETGGTIHFQGDSIDAEGVAGASVDGTAVTITAAGTYTIDGTLDDGQIYINPAKDSEVVINLNNVSVTDSTVSTDGTYGALYAANGKITLTAAEGTENTFITNIDGENGIYSKQDLTINGGGAINVTADGNGIRCKKDLEIGACDLDVTAGNNGIKGDKSVKITKKNRSVTVVSDGDGIKSDLAPETDTTGGTVTINGGTISITANSTTETDNTVSNGDGIQADTLLKIAGGTINITAAGEALKANASSITDATPAEYDGCIEISGGTLDLTAGEDGVKAVKNISVSGGDITIRNSLDGIQVNEVTYTDSTETTVDAYVEGSIDISGGVIDITSTEDGIQCGTGNITISDTADIAVASKLDGIQSENVLNISGGTIDITTNGGAPSGTASSDDSCKGLKAKNLVYISGGTIKINAYDDAVHSNNTVRILGGTISAATGDDGVHGDSYLYIEDGADISVTQCYEGIEAAKIYVNGGAVRVSASDDGVNAAGDEPTESAIDIETASIASVGLFTGMGNNSWSQGGMSGPNQGGEDSATYGYLEINGGYVYVTTSDGDGLDANGDIVINGGATIIDGATSDSEDGLDFDDGVEFNGGFLFAMTAGGMDGISGNYAQKYLLYGFDSSSGSSGPGAQGGGSSSSSLSAGNYCIVDSSDNVLCAFSRSKGGVKKIVFSSPNVSGGTYCIKPLTVSGATAVDSLYGTVGDDYSFTLTDGCGVGSGASYTMSVY